MITEFLDKAFVPLFLIIGFSMKLWNNRGSTDRSLHYYWLTVICTLVLIIADGLEYLSRGNPDMRFWRILFSVIGYVERPTAAVSIVLIIYPHYRRPRYLWIPCLINLLVYCTAFFSPIAFGYAEDYSFVRGPLGYTAFVVSFFYILLAVWLTWKRFRDRDHTRERFVLYLSALACVGATLLDMETEGGHVNTAILISAVFLYMFLRSIDTNRDSLTGLLNRLSFFEDSTRFNTSISGVVSVDMNGLKKINDTVGHEAGDEALKAIGKSLDAVSSRSMLAYRIGGDEFALLCIRQNEETVKQAIETLTASITAKGYTVSTGYAMRGSAFSSVQDLIRWADEAMYVSKAQYYRENGHDRRRNREPREGDAQ